LSAALCPLPRDLRLLELFPPGDQSTEVSGRIAFGGHVFEALRIDLKAFEAAELADVTVLLSRYPYLPVDMLLAAVHIHGVSDVETVLESFLPTINGYTGGGFALAAPQDGNIALPTAVVALLDYLTRVPAVAAGILSDLVATVLPAVLGSLGFPAPATTMAQVALATAAEAPPAATPAVPDPGPTEASDSAAPEAQVSAATGDAVPEPAADPALQSQASPVAAATDSASTVTNDDLLSSESTLGGGTAGASGLDGTSVASEGSTESTDGSAVSSESTSNSADSESTASNESATTGDGGSGGGSTGDASGGGASAEGAG